jgi:hypothetical protein
MAAGADRPAVGPRHRRDFQFQQVRIAHKPPLPVNERLVFLDAIEDRLYLYPECLTVGRFGLEKLNPTAQTSGCLLIPCRNAGHNLLPPTHVALLDRQPPGSVGGAANGEGRRAGLWPRVPHEPGGFQRVPPRLTLPTSKRQ